MEHSYNATAVLVDAETQTDDLAVHALIKLVEDIADENVITSTATPGIPVITESRVVLRPADEAGVAETQEEFEIVDGDESMNPSISSDEQIIVQEEIIVREDINIQGETMDPEMEEFVENLLHEDDVIC